MTDHISGTDTSYRTEFPDFLPETIPPIPDGWLDTSWHNDACPSFNTNTGFQVFIDFTDQDLREWPESVERFTVHLDPEVHDANEPVHFSNDWTNVLAFLVGEQFAADLKQNLGPEKFAAMKRKNETDPRYATTCCASHDYCDANMVMSDAFTAVMCRPPVMGEEGRDAEEQADIALWNAAWEHARKRHIGHRPKPVGFV